MGRWDKPGVPHKGWVLEGIEDIKADCIGDRSFEYEICEMCQHERIRYVHILSHPNYDRVLRVGCDCACRMTEDYDTPFELERRAKNRANRMCNFLKQEWVLNSKGNYVLRYKGYNITAIKRNGSWGFCYNGNWVWEYRERRIYDFDILKIAAFEEFDDDKYR